MNKQPPKLLDNSRFYIMAGSILLSLAIFFGLQVIVPDSRLRGIRLQQIYGLLALVYWYLVLLMSPISKLVARSPKMAAVLYMRRPFGVLVAYFAGLHAAIAFFAQLNGWHGVALLPTVFKVSLILGVLSLLVLLFMSLLSVDYFVKLTHFRGWKTISRLSYLSGIIAIIHVWMIGTHVSFNILQLLAFEGLVILFGLEAWRLGKQLVVAKWAKPRAIIIAASMWLILSFGLIAMRLYVPSYSKTHAEHTESTSGGVILHAH